MLILTRRVGEFILIGDEIEVVVCAVGFDEVRVGIDAPKHVKVLRGELRDKGSKALSFDET